MPNDDLGTFPMPPQTPAEPAQPVAAPQPTQDLQPASLPPVSSPTPAPAPEPAPQPISTFEPTPEVIPSLGTIQDPPPITSPILENEAESLVAANETLIEKQVPAPTPAPVEPPIAPKPAEPSPVPATLPSKSRSIVPIIILVLLLVAGLGLAISAFLFLQTGKLKNQLAEITQTLNKQQTTLTPTPAPSIFEIPTPSTSPISTDSALPETTPTATPLIISSALQPLAQSANILQLAIKHSPNAQLILIKVDNASDPNAAITKYFFREDLQTKKYFYLSLTGNGETQIIDKQIYVTPDDSIPSLNDAILSNQMGLDLDETLKLTYAQCANKDLCISAPVKAQYIKTGSGIIWQLSVYTQGLTATPLTIQINAETKAIIYQSPEFSK